MYVCSVSMLDHVRIQELSIWSIHLDTSSVGSEWKIPMNSMLSWSSLSTATKMPKPFVTSPASRLDGGQSPLVSPIPCSWSQHSRHMWIGDNRCRSCRASKSDLRSYSNANASKRSRQNISKRQQYNEQTNKCAEKHTNKQDSNRIITDCNRSWSKHPKQSPILQASATALQALPGLPGLPPPSDAWRQTGDRLATDWLDVVWCGCPMG